MSLDKKMLQKATALLNNLPAEADKEYLLIVCSKSERNNLELLGEMSIETLIRATMVVGQHIPPHKLMLLIAKIGIAVQQGKTTKGGQDD